MKTAKLKTIALLMTAAFLYTTNGMAQRPFGQKDVPCPSDSISKTVFKGSTNMAYNLFQKADTKKNENIIISPLSLDELLAVIANGADGNTLTQINDAMGIEDVSAENVSGAYSKLNDYFTAFGPKFTIKNNHSVWIDTKFKPKSDFNIKNRNALKAEIRNTSLAVENTRTDMNLLCTRNTNNSIKDAFTKPLSQDSKIILVNTFLFQGTWKYPFDSDVTRLQEFTNADGSKSKIMMMQNEFEYQAFVGDRIDLLRIPYVNGNVYMEVYLPHKGENLDDCMRSLTRKQDFQMRKNATKQKVALDMPRVELKCVTDFKEPLQQMGMTDAFSSEAVLSGISDNSPQITDIKQITCVKISEEGAPAASIRERVKDMDLTQAPLFFTINRPFFFTIREHKSGTILFMGKVRKL